MSTDNKSVKLFPTLRALVYVPAKKNLDLFRRSLAAKPGLVFLTAKKLTAQRDLFLLASACQQPVVPDLYESGSTI